MRARSMALLLGLALLVSSIVVAQDASEPSESQPPHARPRARLVKPWSDMATLTQEQKDKIIEIHADALEAIRQIRTKEQSDIMALLTDENRAELKAWEEKRRADARARRAEGRTPPADAMDSEDD